MGQIYVPRINWLLLVAVLTLVLTFRSSAALAYAFGMAVTGTITITTGRLAISRSAGYGADAVARPPVRRLQIRVVFVCSPGSVMLCSGYLSRLPARRFPEMIIDCAHYQDGRRRDEGPVPLTEAAARCGQGGFVWLGLFEPGDAELAEVRDTFGLHELAVEDAQNFHMRPKIESYDQDVRLVILRTARYDDAAEEVAAQRDLLGTVLEANMAVISVEQTKVSVQQNVSIEQLTILATIFLPLTFVTGFFGQNFGWLIRHLDGPAEFVAYGIGGLVVPLALLFVWLRLRMPHARRAAAP